MRFPVLCSGCSYLGLFYILKRLGLFIIGDIGCYSLCALPPLSSLETCISMGSGLGIALGLHKSLKGKSREKVIGVIGDSTFVHSGITALIDISYNKGATCVIILDNRTTAMTGGQHHPGTGITLKGEKTSRINYVRLAKALNIKRIRQIDCYNIEDTEKTIKEEINSSLPSVIITKNPCLLVSKKKKGTIFRLDLTRCIRCNECLKLGCSALSKSNNKVFIDPKSCRGCTLCAQICPVGAIKEVTG